MKYSDPVLVEQLAGAYVLGTLGAGARRRFERLCQERADVALAVARWQTRLEPLGQGVPAARPSARVWAAIRAHTAPSAPQRARWWLGLWGRAATWGAGGVALGAVLATLLLWGLAPAVLTVEQLAMRSGGKLPPSYVGVLSDGQGQARLLVSSLRQGRILHLKVLGPANAPSTPPLLLWALPNEGAPWPLGPVPQTGSATVELPDTSERLLTQVRTLVAAPSDPGAPAAPGTVVLRGPCAKLW